MISVVFISVSHLSFTYIPCNMEDYIYYNLYLCRIRVRVRLRVRVKVRLACANIDVKHRNAHKTCLSRFVPDAAVFMFMNKFNLKYSLISQGTYVFVEYELFLWYVSSASCAVSPVQQSMCISTWLYAPILAAVCHLDRLQHDDDVNVLM